MGKPERTTDMTVWRMAMRCGNQGYSLWPQCLRHGVAAITYQVLGKTDLARFPKGHPKQLWNQLEPSQKSSLAKVAYEMQPGHTIYVKEGKWIVCRGTVTGPYQFDAEGKIVRPGYEHDPFSHQVPVDWDAGFAPVEISLGAEPTTVLKLDGERLRRLEEAIRETSRKASQGPESQQEVVLQAMEGHAYRAEATFRQRNRALIEAKKMESDGKCSVCGFSFGERYAEITRDCLVAHHVEPIGKRKKASKTTLDDIELLCPNCHAAVHTKTPPLTAAELRGMLIE